MKNIFIGIYVIGVIIMIVSTIIIKNNSINLEIKFNDSKVNDKYNSLINFISYPTYIEKYKDDSLYSVTWVEKLYNFTDFGKYGGLDYIKLVNEPAIKYHPHPASVFVIAGKYMNVPDNLLGPLKYASETINIEQLFIPKEYQDLYGRTGEKTYALVTGSCASVTVSALTVYFVEDMIQKYKDSNKNTQNLYKIFRNEYDNRVKDYLCGKGIIPDIPWYHPESFGEEKKINLELKICN